MMYTKKDTYGRWQTTSSKDLPDGRRLNISTKKHPNGGSLITTATVCKVDGIWETHTPFSDFNKRLEQSAHMRITAKTCETQHSHHDIEQIALEAIAFYREKEHGNTQG